jgi:hypothetical protein
MTGPEAAAFNAVKTGFRDALPKSLENYTLELAGSGFGGEFEVYQATKPDGMAPMKFTATYKLDSAVLEQGLQSPYLDRAKGTPEQQAKLADLEAREASLKKGRDKASGGEKERIRAEIKAVQAEASAIQDQIMADYQAWVMSRGANAAMVDSAKALPPKELEVQALVNQDLSITDMAAPYPLAGYPLAFEQREGCQRPGDTCITVFIGSFDKEKRVSGYTRYNLRKAGLGVTTKPRGLALVVSGPKDKPESARNLLGRIDLARLKGLVP